MLAVRKSGSDVAVVEIAEPDGPGWTVHVRFAGICGSDLSFVSSDIPHPVTLGHEIAGILDDGSPVLVEPLAVCGVCGECRKGAYNRCRDVFAGGFGVGRDGGMAQRLVVPERCIVRLPSTLDLGLACLAEPLAVGLHAVRIAGVTASDRVLVIGAGSIGLMTVVAAVAQGCHVATVARYDHQAAIGLSLGASAHEDGEYDVVIDSVGSADTLAQAVTHCVPGGRLVAVGAADSEAKLPTWQFLSKELRVLASAYYSSDGSVRDIERAVRLLDERAEQVRAVITHRFGLTEAPQAFRTAADRSSGAIKVVLEP